MKLFLPLLASPFVLAATGLAAAPDDSCTASKAHAPRAAGEEQDIVSTALAAGSFGTLAKALEAAGLVDALRGDGPFTVFAPTDAAFAKLPEGALASLLEPGSKDRLASILTYHVVPGRVPAKEVAKRGALTTLQGQRLEIAVGEEGVTVDGAAVTKADVRCSNGVIHVVDTVLLPSSADVVATAVEAGSFTTLAAALEAAGLVEALQGEGPFTVLAPTDAAFAKLPEGTLASLLEPESSEKLVAILKHHVVAGRLFGEDVVEAGRVTTLGGTSLTVRADDGTVRIGEATVVRADVDASNGVIHVIDRVLLP